MHVNWKKGFNRVFVLVAVGWATYILWYVPVKQWHERFDMASDKWTLCLSTASGDKIRVAECNAEHEKDFQQIPHTAWTDFGWSSWLQLIGIAAISLFVVYWLLRGAGFASNWIWRGFTTRV